MALAGHEGECDQDRLRAEELEDRVVESLLATLSRRELLEDAVERWGEIVERSRPRRERELAAVEARIRKAQGALDRYFQAFEEGRLREEVCTRRIEELSAELTSLDARRSDLGRGGIGEPAERPGPCLLAVGDGALGFWGAIRDVFPETRWQRDWVHKVANILNALPASVQAAAKRALREIWDAEDRSHAEAALDAFARDFAKWPKAVSKLTSDREALLAFYDFPAEHWIHLRTSNPIESTFSPVRARTDVTKGPGSPPPTDRRAEEPPRHRSTDGPKNDAARSSHTSVGHTLTRNSITRLRLRVLRSTGGRLRSADPLPWAGPHHPTTRCPPLAMLGPWPRTEQARRGGRPRSGPCPP